MALQWMFLRLFGRKRHSVTVQLQQHQQHLRA
jgi:hypothetical protein